MQFAGLDSRRNRVVDLIPTLRTDPRFAAGSDLSRLLDEFVESNDQINSIIADLRSDPRVSALNGMMLSTGSGAAAFEQSHLEMWYLWSVNEHGAEVTKAHLDSWLDADEVEVIATLWVHGLKVDDAIELADGYSIVSPTRMPDSTHKEQAVQFKMPAMGEVSEFPTAAITRMCCVRKVRKGIEVPTPERDTEFWSTQQRLLDIATVLNVLPGVSCLPAFSTGYCLPTNPYGPFGGSGGGVHMYDVIGRHQTTLTQEHREPLLSALADFQALPDKEQQRFRRILGRLSQGKRRFEIEDKIMDLGIALEMLLLRDNPHREQLALTFRLHGAWLVSAATEERLQNYKILQDLYDNRSRVAHTGLLAEGNPQRITEVRDAFPSYQALAERICRQLLHKPMGREDWKAVVIGAANTLERLN
jgi:hypothetical protein